MTRIADPLPFFGIPSGLEEISFTKAEKATLLRAVAILEDAHDLLAERDPDHSENEDLADALCMAPPAIRALLEGIPL